MAFLLLSNPARCKITGAAQIAATILLDCVNSFVILWYDLLSQYFLTPLPPINITARKLDA